MLSFPCELDSLHIRFGRLFVIARFYCSSIFQNWPFLQSPRISGMSLRFLCPLCRRNSSFCPRFTPKLGSSSAVHNFTCFKIFSPLLLRTTRKFSPTPDRRNSEECGLRSEGVNAEPHNEPSHSADKAFVFPSLPW